MKEQMRIMGEEATSYITSSSMSIMDKLTILSDAAKYDVACTSSGVERKGNGSSMGNSISAGICHSFSADGRCISLLKVLFTNECIYDCKYCLNRKSNDVPRATFTPEELCELTMQFYRRNYIEGLFLSSGIVNSPDYTMELIAKSILLLRTKYHFMGYIHVKAIPGASLEIIQRLGFYADRMSVNLEFPTAEGLRMLAPNKHRKNILAPMRLVQNGITTNKEELVHFKNAPSFVPAGQSTQMIIGATQETDYQIMTIAENMYHKFNMKRVFYSAFIHVNEDKELPALPGGPPLLREHRLYQADFLLRFYGYQTKELLDDAHPNFNEFLDPKANWAVNHLEFFPVEINRADYRALLRVPGIGVKSAQRIVQARRIAKLRFEDLKKIGVVLKRALYFITCQDRMMYPTKIEEDFITRNLIERKDIVTNDLTYRQISLFDDVQGADLLLQQA
ncbi:MAG TPA: putative DNA modification/repair radical SAM protein [Lachnospiraceae bacterium]|nr:putative DNA modification/repair radical SAM protein [Lachnospiraceae bacterium]HPF29435.1 putative DNA modification/repair radical SAM protein [Lachnospiraceae bacterium]